MAKNSPSFVRSSQAKSSGNFKIATGAVVCSEAHLLGDVTIGARTVIHPTVRILAEGGPIIIGNNNLLMERTTIINKKRMDGTMPTMVIADGNVFEFSSHCESPSVGNDNVFEAKCYVGDSVTVTDRCVIGACCTVDTANETLPPGTVITGGDQLKWCREPTTQASNSQQLDVLVKLLPNFHKLIKSSS